MPSVRQGLHSENCALSAYETPMVGDVAETAQTESARAAAFHAGFVGEPSKNKALDTLAKKCATTILSGQCPLWEEDKVKGGFILR